VVADNKVIEHLNLEQLPGPDQVTRDFDVRFRWVGSPLG
jgi:hypothetical protein